MTQYQSHNLRLDSLTQLKQEEFVYCDKFVCKFLCKFEREAGLILRAKRKIKYIEESKTN
jgi:hypothetical protein